MKNKSTCVSGHTINILDISIFQKKKKKRNCFQCRGHRFDPWLITNIPHAEGQLSLCTTTTAEPMCSGAHVPQWRTSAARNKGKNQSCY